jgi:hypothetical protein
VLKMQQLSELLSRLIRADVEFVLVGGLAAVIVGRFFDIRTSLFQVHDLGSHQQCSVMVHFFLACGFGLPRQLRDLHDLRVAIRHNRG